MLKKISYMIFTVKLINNVEKKHGTYFLLEWYMFLAPNNKITMANIATILVGINELNESSCRFIQYCAVGIQMHYRSAFKDELVLYLDK